MLPKQNKATRKDIDLLFKYGQQAYTPFCFIRYMVVNQEEPPPPKVSFVAPKSVVNKATKRNTLRRMGYNAINMCFHMLPHGFVAVFVFNKKSLSLVGRINKEEKTRELSQGIEEFISKVKNKA